MRHLLKYLSVLLCCAVFVYGAAMDKDAAGGGGEAGISLTQKEKDFLKTHPVITAQNEADFPPYNFYEEGKPKGFSIEYLNLLTKRLGIRVKYISGQSWTAYMEMAQKSKIDVMLNIRRTPPRERSSSILHNPMPGRTRRSLPTILASKPCVIWMERRSL